MGESTSRIWSAPMPKWRSASARARSGVRSIDCRTPSSTTKSLPAPCIFTKFQIMMGTLSRIKRGLSVILGYWRADTCYEYGVGNGSAMMPDAQAYRFIVLLVSMLFLHGANEVHGWGCQC